MALLCAMCSMLAVQLAIGISLVVDCFTAPDVMTLHLAVVYHGRLNRPAYAAGVLFYSVVVAAALYPLADLLLLHMVLIWKGITTWDYIMANRGSTLESSQLSRAAAKVARQLASFGLRSTRIRDESLSSSSSGGGGAGGSGGQREGVKGVAAASPPHRKVGINPCLACRTDVTKLSTVRPGSQPSSPSHSPLRSAANIDATKSRAQTNTRKEWATVHHTAGLQVCAFNVPTVSKAVNFQSTVASAAEAVAANSVTHSANLQDQCMQKPEQVTTWCGTVHCVHTKL